MWRFRTKQAAAPTPTAETRAEAAQNPNGWVYVLDGVFPAGAAVPPERIVGAWRVDASGKLTDEFKHNPNYVARKV